MYLDEPWHGGAVMLYNDPPGVLISEPLESLRGRSYDLPHHPICGWIYWPRLYFSVMSLVGKPKFQQYTQKPKMLPDIAGLNYNSDYGIRRCCSTQGVICKLAIRTHRSIDFRYGLVHSNLSKTCQVSYLLYTGDASGNIIF